MHDANTVKQVIASQEVLLARFAALKASNQFTEISVPMSNIDFSGISAYLVAIELEYMQAAQDIAAGKENAGVQRLLDNALHNRTMLKNSVTHGSRALMLSRVEPVSYTHLDVYKRQPITQALFASTKQTSKKALGSENVIELQFIPPFVVRKIFLYEVITVQLFAFVQATPNKSTFVIPIAVSYTHL